MLSICAIAVLIQICKMAFAAPVPTDIGRVIAHSTAHEQSHAMVCRCLLYRCPRRPLFPGNIMPVSVQDPRLVRELLELKRSR